MTGCVSYGHQRFVPTPEQSAQMEADSLRVQRAERAERTERRRENREDMMDAANAKTCLKSWHWNAKNAPTNATKLTARWERQQEQLV